MIQVTTSVKNRFFNSLRHHFLSQHFTQLEGRITGELPLTLWDVMRIQTQERRRLIVCDTLHVQTRVRSKHRNTRTILRPKNLLANPSPDTTSSLNILATMF